MRSLEDLLEQPLLGVDVVADVALEHFERVDDVDDLAVPGRFSFLLVGSDGAEESTIRNAVAVQKVTTGVDDEVDIRNPAPSRAWVTAFMMRSTYCRSVDVPRSSVCALPTTAARLWVDSTMKGFNHSFGWNTTPWPEFIRTPGATATARL